MGILDRLRGELIDIIEWLENDDSTVAYRFERYGNEIKNGAQLTVREGQTAVFVNEGRLADVFAPGRYELATENLPILSTLKGWKYGFKSPFKAEVYFISSRSIAGFGWGTPAPFYTRDPDYGALQMTARGTFDMHVVDAATFLRNVVGTDGEVTKEEINDRLRRKFVTQAVTAITEMQMPYLNMSQAFADVSDALKSRIEPHFTSQFGIAIEEVNLMAIQLTEESQAKLERQEDLSIDTRYINTYERRARADAMVKMAENPGAGGMGANMMGLGAGMAVANQMAGGFGMQPMMGMGGGGGMQPAMAVAPPPPPAAVTFHVAVNGQTMGPYQPQQLAQMAQAGQLTPQTSVWRQGMAAWTPAGSVPDLQQIFAPAGPPPPPPAPGAPPAPPAPPAE